MVRHHVAALCLVLAVPVAGRATDVELGTELGGEYDDNVFSTGGDPQSDVLGRFGPRLRVLDEGGAFTWEVVYRPVYRVYNRFGELDGWDQDVLAGASWRIGPQTKLSVSDRYLDYSNFSQVLTEELLPDGSIDTGVDFGRQSLKQNTASVGLEHQLERRHLLGLNASRTDSRFVSDFRNKTVVTGAGANYYYVFDETDRAGFAAGATRQTIEGTFGGDDIETDYYNLSILWLHHFDPTMSLNLSVGPTLVEQDPTRFPALIEDQAQFPLVPSPSGGPALTEFASCPRLGDGTVFFGEGCAPLALPAGVRFQPTFTDLPVLGETELDNDSLTYFASISLDKSWRQFYLRLNYTRDASTTTQVAGVVRDVFTGVLSYRPSDHWRFTVSASYQRREQPTGGFQVVQVLEETTVQGDGVERRVKDLSPAPPQIYFVPVKVPIAGVAESVGFRLLEVDDQIDTNQYVVAVVVQYYVRRNLFLYANAYWNRDEVNFGGVTRSQSDRLRVGVGLVYTFDRLQLPI
jgi:hypothetical protein